MIGLKVQALRSFVTGATTQIDVFNMMGEHLLHKTTSNTHLTLDVLAGSPARVYLVRITYNKEVVYERVVKR